MFTVRELLYADDAGILFNSRLDMQAGLDALVTHLFLFGLECHYSPEGTPPDDSKSQCVFFPAPNATVIVADEQPITISAHDVENRTFPAGAMPFVRTFKYLGSVLNQDLNDNADVANRIRSAQAAFGALRCVFKIKTISLPSKKNLYLAAVLPMLLFGSETWTMNSNNTNKLRRFHNDCIRSISGINRWKQWKCKISNETLFKKIGVQPVEFYIDLRTLRWIGHLSRMGNTRLPKMLFFSWDPTALTVPLGRRAQFGSRARTLLQDLATSLTQPEQQRMADVDRTCDAKEKLKAAKQAVKMQGRKVGPAKKEGHAQYEAALQILHILANQQGEAEATLKTATSLSKFKQTDFSSAPNHAAMKPIANWMSFATNRECWKAIVKNFVEKKYR